MSTPKISVIIPNYNREMLIGETLKNLLNQTLPPYEIIVVDDGSTDRSVDIIQEFGDKVTLIKQTNQGPGAARNAGLKVASGEFIQLFDSDDLCSLNKLELQAQSLTDNNADIVYSPWAPLELENGVAKLIDQVVQQGAAAVSHEHWKAYLRGWAIVFQACMFRHSFIKSVGNYRTDLMPSEDSEFLFRMLLSNPVVAFEPGAMVLYRTHDLGQITTSGTSVLHRVRDWSKCIASIDGMIENNDKKIDSLTRLLWDCTRWKSASDCRKNSIELTAGHKIRFEGIYPLLFKIRQWYGGIKSRLYGSRFNRNCRAAPITQNQIELVRQAGYETKEL
jgi:glycosyltransferase involved in cell wall biosynthesis